MDRCLAIWLWNWARRSRQATGWQVKGARLAEGWAVPVGLSVSAWDSAGDRDGSAGRLALPAGGGWDRLVAEACRFSACDLT